ncbi:MAG: hypothetical protein AAGN35_01415 [Bacteroidota bacterium]
MKKLIFIFYFLILGGAYHVSAQTFVLCTDTVHDVYYPVRGDTVDMQIAPDNAFVLSGVVLDVTGKPIYRWTSAEMAPIWARFPLWPEAKNLAGLNLQGPMHFATWSTLGPGKYSLLHLSGYTGSGATGVIVQTIHCY